MKILQRIQNSKVTVLGYQSSLENLVWDHLSLLEGVVKKIPAGTCEEIMDLFHTTAEKRDNTLSVLLENPKIFYILDVNDLVMESPEGSILRSTALRKVIGHLNNCFYKSDLDISLVILTGVYTNVQSGEMNAYGGNSLLHEAELVIIFSEPSIKIEKDRRFSYNMEPINTVAYQREFYLNQLI